MSDVGISFISSNIVALEFTTGSMTKGIYKPYVAQTGDRVSADGVLYRGKAPIGLIDNANAQTYLPFDKFSDTKWSSFFGANSAGKDPAQLIASYGLTVNGKPLSVAEVSTKTEVVDTAQVSRYDFSFIEKHTVYLQLNTPIALNSTVSVAVGDGLGIASVKFDPSAIRSDAVHVSQIGFAPKDTTKVAYLSAWTGFDGAGVDTDQSVSYAAGTGFSVINVKTGKSVYNGTITQTFDQVGTTRSTAGTDVYKMDFSAVTAAGEYKVVVDGVGSSYNFKIANSVWTDTFQVGLKGLYSQRSGIDISSSYSNISHLASFGPGTVVYQSTATLMDTSMGLNLTSKSSFTELVAGATSTVVADAWGGWSDAGDWDRRIQHTSTVRQLLTLAEINPKFIGSIKDTSPDLNTKLPAVVEEALWGLDVFRRMQSADGGISGGIESGGDAKVGDTSWNSSTTLYAYAPDAWSSYEYASAAARAAAVVGRYDPKLAEVYLASAEKAFAWAEKNTPDYAANSQALINSRNLAAAELFKDTGKQIYNDAYLDSSSYLVNSKATGDLRQIEAAWVYSTATGATATVVANGLANLTAFADAILKVQSKEAFGNADLASIRDAFGNTAVTPAIAAQVLVFAHIMTGQQKYLDGIMSDAQYGLGANPNNLVYTTGLGQNSVQEITHVDATSLGGTPVGISVFGNYDRTSFGDQYWLNYLDPDMRAQYLATPVDETFLGFNRAAQVAEYSIGGTMGPNIFVWGYLAENTYNIVSSNACTPPQVPSGTPATPAEISPLLTAALDAAAGHDVAGLLTMIADGDLDGFSAPSTAYSDSSLAVTINTTTGARTILDRTKIGSVLVGTAGDDRMFGSEGDDVLYGLAGTDRLFGGNGNDTLIATGGFAWGDAGDDYLIATGSGSKLYGGAGADHFVIDAIAGQTVNIMDFEIGIDHLDLSAPLSDNASLSVSERNGSVYIVAGQTTVQMQGVTLSSIWQNGQFAPGVIG